MDTEKEMERERQRGVCVLWCGVLLWCVCVECCGVECCCCGVCCGVEYCCGVVLLLCCVCAVLWCGVLLLCLCVCVCKRERVRAIAYVTSLAVSCNT